VLDGRREKQILSGCAGARGEAEYAVARGEGCYAGTDGGDSAREVMAYYLGQSGG
jgi:hypothetical protein